MRHVIRGGSHGDATGVTPWSTFAFKYAPTVNHGRNVGMTPEREAELVAEIDRLRAEVVALRDDPTFDVTDAAHPAWWRGHDYVSARFKDELDKARRERDDAKADFESLEHDAAAVLRAWSRLADNETDFYSLCPTELRTALDNLRDNGLNDFWWEKK